MIENENELLKLVIEASENKDYKNVISLIDNNESLIKKTYYKLCEYKILALFNLKKYIDAKLLIKEELSVPYVPRDFEEFLVKINKEVDISLKDNNQKTLCFDDLVNIDKFDNETLVSVLPKLKDFNIKTLAPKIQRIFDSEAIANLTKSLLIACLSDNQLNFEFYVRKEDVIIKFNPITVYDIRKGDNTLYLDAMLEKYDYDINIKELIHRLYMTYLLEIYPLVISESTLDVLFIACYKMAFDMYYKPITDKEIINKYDNAKQKVDGYIEKINNLIENI